MRIIITGGSGFIGKEIINFLKSHELMIIGRKNQYFFKKKNISFVKSNLLKIDKQKNKIMKFNPEICIHLFYQGIPNYSLKNSILNYNLSLKFFKILKLTSCKKIICTGSCWEYKNTPGGKSHISKINTVNPFTKYKNKLHKFLLNNFDKKNIVWCRVFYCYGFSNNKKSLTNIMLESIKTRKKIKILNQNTKCDFIYVKNVAYIISKLINKQYYGIYNIGSGKLISIKKFINIFNQILPKKKKIVYKNLNLESKFNNIYANNIKIKKIPKNLPFSFNSSLKDIIKNNI
tara:strand:- start:278 stop:1144 length:867 start_codon:yes stop_codon:yes gene_type:complete